MLCLAGEGEPKITLDIARECITHLLNPLKRLVIFTAEEGGEAHCQVNNPALPNRVLFDWLNSVFSANAPGRNDSSLIGIEPDKAVGE